MVQAAIDSSQPPLAVIFDDPEHEWGVWDYRLIKALAFRKMYGDIPPWIDRSDRVTFEVKSYISKSEAALERKQKQLANGPRPGQKFYAVPVTMDGGPMPTMQEWAEQERIKQGFKTDTSTPPER